MPPPLTWFGRRRTDRRSSRQDEASQGAKYTHFHGQGELHLNGGLRVDRSPHTRRGRSASVDRPGPTSITKVAHRRAGRQTSPPGHMERPCCLNRHHHKKRVMHVFVLGMEFHHRGWSGRRIGSVTNDTDPLRTEQRLEHRERRSTRQSSLGS